MGSPAQCKKWRESLSQKDKATQLRKAREWKRAHPEQVKRVRSDYFQKHKEKEYASQVLWYDANPGKKKEHGMRYREKHRTSLRKRKRARLHKDLIYLKNRYERNVQFNLACRLRASLGQALRRAGIRKSQTTFSLIGCSPQALVKHIESLFLPGMSWERRKEIHIDHKRPIASFDLSNPVERQACFHYSNLQPLWAADNRRKGAFYNPEERRAA